MRADLEFLFECSTRYPMCEHSSHVLFCLLHKHTNENVFEDFLKIFDHVLKFFEDFSKLFRRPDERLRTFSKDNRKLAKIAELTTKEDPKMFRSYTNKLKGQKRNVIKNDNFTCEDIISFFYHFDITRCFTGVYMIKIYYLESHSWDLL